jgi:multisubunit Na+/H+ antiporter MnhG subunit
MTSDPPALAILAAVAAIAAVATWLVATVAATRLVRRPVVASICSALAAPVATVAIGWTTFVVDVSRHPRSDMPSMALAGWLMMAAAMPVVTAPVAVAVLLRARRRSRRERS